MYWTYIMASFSRCLYVGVTNELLARVYQHREGKAGFTGRYRINRLVHYEHTIDVRWAIAREKEVKGWTRARKIALIERENMAWRDLAEPWLGPAPGCHPEGATRPKDLVRRDWRADPDD